MKIIDSSFLIAMLSDTNCEEIISKLTKLNHKLIIPYCVCQELIFGSSGQVFQNMINKNIFVVVQFNTIEEIISLQTSYPYLGFGELDTILTYEKIKEKK